MPPRKRAANAASPAHPGASCDAPRIEAFKVTNSEGDEVTVTRCMECGEQIVS